MMTTTAERELREKVRLDSYVKEYLALEHEKEVYYETKLEDKDLSRTTIHTLYLMQERIDLLTRKIITMVDRMRSNDFDIDNEVAILVYDYYEPQLRRGLSDLF